MLNGELMEFMLEFILTLTLYDYLLKYLWFLGTNDYRLISEIFQKLLTSLLYLAIN